MYRSLKNYSALKSNQVVVLFIFSLRNFSSPKGLVEFLSRLLCCALQVAAYQEPMNVWNGGSEPSAAFLVVIDLLVGAVLVGPGGQRVVVADGAGQVVHQTQLSFHWALDDQGDGVKQRSPLHKLGHRRESKREQRKKRKTMTGNEWKRRQIYMCINTETPLNEGRKTKDGSIKYTKAKEWLCRQSKSLLLSSLVLPCKPTRGYYSTVPELVFQGGDGEEILV